jgi:C_GCAxxG_C_C family probable redox protein
MNKAEIAAAQFSKGSACSQAVAVAFAGDIGIDPVTVHRLTTGFGGGMGGNQYTCGAITGGVFVLSAGFGSGNPDEAEKKALTKELTARFIKAVETRLGSSSCRNILEMTLDEAREKNLFSTVCDNCVRVAAEELDRLMGETAAKSGK